LDFIQSAVNWILALLGLITIIILIYGGFQMVTAAWDDNKYKKGFTIVKQAVIGLILIGVSALIVNLIFSFVNTNTTTTGWWGS
jgi:phosphate starvation-inducible membrane PsiE